jgi:glycosyltransferase involved in cell wall biosynthesis
MKVVILTIADFPEGLAITNRSFYFAKGLIDNGNESEVIVVRPTEIPGHVKNTEQRGIYNGVPFSYSNGKTIRSRSFFVRRFDDMIGPVLAAVKTIKNKNDAAILVGSNSFYHPMIFKILFRLAKIKFIVEQTELMFHNKKSSGIYRIKNILYEKIIYRNLDAFIVMTPYLKESYKDQVSKKTPIYLLPVLVDSKEIYKPDVKRTRDLVYTGPLHHKKDGILTIIEAFSNIAAEFEDTNLILTGNIRFSPDRDKIHDLMKDNPFKDRIIFTGFVQREEMIRLMNSAAGLLSAKPSGIQADSCFPTKFGEYLSTANPCVVTDTGDVSLYLKDGVNAYVATADSVDSFSAKLRELLSDPARAKIIGEAGKKVAIENFDHKENALKTIEIINKIRL